MKTSIILAVMLMTASLAVSAYTATSTEMNGAELAADDKIIAFITFEDSIDRDLTGDNDTADYVLQYYDISSDRVKNTGREGRHPSVYEDSVAYEDKSRVIFLYNTYTKEAKITGERGTHPSIFDQRIGFVTAEKDAEADLNSDGDQSDNIVQYYDISTGKAVNTKEPGEKALMLKDLLVYDTPEDAVNSDLNRDGDRNDNVIQYIDFENNDVVNTRQEGEAPAGFKEGAIIASDGKQFVILDLNEKKSTATGMFGNNPSLYGDIIAYEKNKTLHIYRISTNVDKSLNITGKNPVIYNDMIAFIDDKNEVSFIKGEDPDYDSIPDFADNCPMKGNTDQADSDADGTGDACEEAPVQNTTSPAENTTNSTTLQNTTAQQNATQQITAQATAPLASEQAAQNAQTNAAQQAIAQAQDVSVNSLKDMPARRELPDTMVLAQEKKDDKNPAYWFMLAVGIIAISILVYTVVPRWMKKRRKSYGF